MLSAFFKKLKGRPRQTATKSQRPSCGPWVPRSSVPFLADVWRANWGLNRGLAGDEFCLLSCFKEWGFDRTHLRLRGVRAEPDLHAPLSYPVEHSFGHLRVSPCLQQPESNVLH